MGKEMELGWLVGREEPGFLARGFRFLGLLGGALFLLLLLGCLIWAGIAWALEASEQAHRAAVERVERRLDADGAAQALLEQMRSLGDFSLRLELPDGSQLGTGAGRCRAHASASFLVRELEARPAARLLQPRPELVRELLARVARACRAEDLDGEARRFEAASRRLSD